MPQKTSKQYNWDEVIQQVKCSRPGPEWKRCSEIAKELAYSNHQMNDILKRAVKLGAIDQCEYNRIRYYKINKKGIAL